MAFLCSRSLERRTVNKGFPWLRNLTFGTAGACNAAFILLQMPLLKPGVKKTLLYSLYLLVVVFAALEIILRLYNPFPFRLKNDRILLPINQQLTITNSINPKLDKEILHRRNSLGFRGPEPGDSLERSLSLITIGGSTTACTFLSEGDTWPDKLSVLLKQRFASLWVNNAGLDGHSTFGHQVLLHDHLLRLRPKVLLFLVGVNDVENDQPTFHDKLNTKGAWSDLKHFLFTNSEVLNLGWNIARGWNAQRMNNTTHKELNLVQAPVLFLSPEVRQGRLAKQERYLLGFQKRISQLVDTCRAYNIRPVFLTQPSLLGKGRDPVTGTDLENIRMGEDLNGALLWALLSRYNDVTRATCRDKAVPLIDLAALMPKNSLYFYDASHFTEAGAEKVASLLLPPLEQILKNTFPAYGNEGQ